MSKVGGAVDRVDQQARAAVGIQLILMEHRFGSYD